MLGRLAQLGERLPYKQDVGGSSPSSPIKRKGVVYHRTTPFFMKNITKTGVRTPLSDILIMNIPVQYSFIQGKYV